MDAYTFFLNFLYSFLATILGGGVLAFIFFWLKEKIFPLPKVDGAWFFEVKTINSSYNPYKGMTLRYVAMIWLEGNHIQGTIEKIYEKSSKNGELVFIGRQRTRGRVKGFVKKNYFSEDRITLHITESGHGRESTHFHELTVQQNASMSGTFSSMVANQNGTTTWQRQKF